MRSIIAVSGIISLAACTSAPPPPAPADVVLRGGRVFTADAAHPWVEAVALRGARIAAVGTDVDVARLIGTGTDVIELGGRTVLPGLHDAHVHPVGAGREQQGCSLTDLATVEAILAKVRGCAEAKPGDGWIVGRGWNLSLFAQANPHKRLLDEIVPTRPVYLEGADGHSSWLNSAGLARVGIVKGTPDPPQGVIERDGSGEPSGTLRESAAALAEQHLPEPTLASDVAALRWAVAELHRVGITSIMDGGVDERRLEAYRELARDGSLRLRGVACIVVEPGDAKAALAHARKLRADFSSLPMRPSCAKIFLDGVLEGETAALIDPYLDRPGHKGEITTTQAKLDETVALLERDGFAVHMHVIGDGAVRAALDSYQAATTANSKAGQHRTLAHLQLVHPNDAPRFAALGVAVNAQALWAYPDSYILDVNLPQVGRARVDRMYPWGTLVRAGASVVGGSDWPVSSVNPFEAIEVMVRRQDPARADGPVLGNGEELPLHTALLAFTSQAARLLGHDDEVGALRPGARADLVVLDRALSEREPTAISDAKPWLTFFDGAIIYRAPRSP